MNVVQLHVLEGPAGSGKSTLARRLVRTLTNNGMRVLVIKPTIAGFSDPRGERVDQDPYRYVCDSLLLDNLRLIEVFRHPGHEVYLLDRFYLSQLVYEPLRTHPENVNPLEAPPFQSQSLDGIGTFIGSIFDSLWLRMGLAPDSRPGFNLSWTFLLPSPAELNRRRALTDQRYPYSAAQETFMYARLYSAIARQWRTKMMGDDPSTLLLDKASPEVQREADRAFFENYMATTFGPEAQI